MHFVKRNYDIVFALLNGATYQKAATIHNLSRERIRQIWQDTRRRMQHPNHLIDVEYPEHDASYVKIARKYKKFWINQLNKLQLK